jgi:hypothetical protein
MDHGFDLNFKKIQKLTHINILLKNQEDEIIIQLDKINQKPILYLLKEMGLTDLEIYQNLQYSDFFYFNKPLLINSKRLNQPLSRFNLNSIILKIFQNFQEFLIQLIID